MTQLERQLLGLLLERSLRLGTFKLSSGDTSSYYIDGKMAQVYSKGAAILGEVLYEHTKDLEFDAIGGLAVGAIPLVTAAVISYHHHNRELEGFFVRDGAKQHGTKKVIEGNLQPGSRVVIVEDVVTQGSSVAKAIQAVTGIGCKVVRVITIVDRQAGAADVFRQLGITDYQAVFTIDELLRAAGNGSQSPQTPARG